MNGHAEPSAELRALGEALAGIAPPCRTSPDPNLWFDDAEAAIIACRTGCHALAQCLAVALAHGEAHGVWGGRDLTRSVKRGDKGMQTLTRTSRGQVAS